ncbi:MAG: RES family NAD+ phosphorylase [Cytophagaceae bacterium]|nr:RES family NAD+ phosphorylase [Cytophagaceae bacterium]
MRVYRISLARWADRLTASGHPARWNSKGRFVLYTAASRALACLENVVHRSGEGLHEAFRVMTIDVPDTVPIELVDETRLPGAWTHFEFYAETQAFGDEWIQSGRTAILKVPSALIPHEFNFLINPAHPDFPQIQLLQTEPFVFDSRL